MVVALTHIRACVIPNVREESLVYFAMLSMT